MSSRLDRWTSSWSCELGIVISKGWQIYPLDMSRSRWYSYSPKLSRSES